MEKQTYTNKDFDFIPLGLTVTVKQELDEQPDLSWLGDYTSKQPKWNANYIDRETGKLYINGKCYKSFESDLGRHEYAYFVFGNDYEGSGIVNQVKYLMQDYNRMKAYNNSQWYMTIVTVEVMLDHINLGYASLGGIESDCDKKYLDSVIKDCIFEAAEQANKSIEKVKVFA